MAIGGGGANRGKTRKFTEEELERVKMYSSIRLPNHQIATLLKISKDYFDELVNKDSALRNALEEGRSKGSLKARKNLFQKAFDDGDVQAMKFWCQTQEGFKITEHVEHTGLNGGPIATVQVEETEEAILKAIEENTKLLQKKLDK